MSLRKQYDTLGRAPSHRIPRCTTCHLVLPCRNDGTWGPCDARDVSHESHARVCELLRAVFEVPEHESLDDIVEAESERDGQLASARAASNVVRPAFCKNGHEQTGANVYEGLRNGRYRVWCAVCQKEQYARKHAQRNEMAASDDCGLGTDSDGVLNCTV